MGRAAIYCRLSEEDRNKQSEEDDSNSIQNQKAMLLQYAASQGWEVFRIYSDDDYTGSDRNRPEFKQLLADAEAYRFDIVLCKTRSRFTRELELVERYIHGLFPLWGIRFVSIVDNADTDNKGNKKSRQIKGLVNEWYLEDMSENIRSVLTSRRQHGFHIGAFALYGYRKDPERKGHLLVDEEAAAVVREVFILCSQGYGKTAIARMLNDRGVPNPTEYKRLHGLHYRQLEGKNSTCQEPDRAGVKRSGALPEHSLDPLPQVPPDDGLVGPLHPIPLVPVPGPVLFGLIGDAAVPALDHIADIHLVGQHTGDGRIPPKGTVRCAGCGCVLRSSKSRGRHYLQCPTRYVSEKASPGPLFP